MRETPLRHSLLAHAIVAMHCACWATTNNPQWCSQPFDLRSLPSCSLHYCHVLTLLGKICQGHSHSPPQREFHRWNCRRRRKRLVPLRGVLGVREIDEVDSRKFLLRWWRVVRSWSDDDRWGKEVPLREGNWACACFEGNEITSLRTKLDMNWWCRKYSSYRHNHHPNRLKTGEWVTHREGNFLHRPTQ